MYEESLLTFQRRRFITTKTHEFFREILDETDLPGPERINERSPIFLYPELMIMFIAVLSVNSKIETYAQIHKMVLDYWDEIAQGTGLKPISECQLSDC